jgi:class 3 adenylate cyclase
METEESAPPVRSTLFRKYFISILSAVIVPLFLMTSLDAWFGYRDQKLVLDSLLRSEANAASSRVQGFIDSIKSHLDETVHQPWSSATTSEHYLNALNFLRQAPAALNVTLVDDRDQEQLFISRVALNRMESGLDYSDKPEIENARKYQFWLSGMEYSGNAEPRMKIAVAGERLHSGAAVAEINLKLIRDAVSQVHIGESGYALILSARGELMAHPDISKVLTGNASISRMQDFRKSFVAADDQIVTTIDPDGTPVVAAMAAPLKGANWAVFVVLPKAEAFAPIYLALWRAAGLLLGGGVLAAGVSYVLANRMIVPIRQLEDGARMVGSGKLDHRIHVATGDEFERLAMGFNKMAEELAISQERSERISRLKRFLAPQVAALVEQTGNESVLESQRAEIVAVFCDLRGFTAFAAQWEPEVVMEILSSYYQALGSVISRYQATLTNFAADGLMVLLNAPVPCKDPAVQAIRMASDMQIAVQELVEKWKERGFDLGFGIGLSMGWATVGRIGYEDRADYTAIGSAVNLASRLCALAEDRQILFDQSVALKVPEVSSMTKLGERQIKGFDRLVAVFTVALPLDTSAAQAI